MANKLTPTMRAFLEEPIAVMEAEGYLDIRTLDCLDRHGIIYVKDLLNVTENRLMSIPNLGQESMNRIFIGLAANGFVKNTHQYHNS
jgi:DNA-directed RNA polymerase alpha subunit